MPQIAPYSKVAGMKTPEFRAPRRFPTKSRSPGKDDANKI